ncbi:MAG TPA: glycosyltransferase [Caulobacteraceae bacterium]
MSEARLADAWTPRSLWRDHRLSAAPYGEGVHLVDTTMLYAPKSGGVKRYLLAKQAWLKGRPGLRHTLVAPGTRTEVAREGLVRIASPRLPFTDGYRCPTNLGKWTRVLRALGPDLIEAGDPYIPGHAALEAGQEQGVPVVGFCHTDAVALAQLQLGEWAVAPTLKAWSQFCRRFDRVVAPSHHIKARLAEYGIDKVAVQHLGVDVDLFRPDRADRQALLTRLDLPSDARLLVFAGRPSREKNIDMLVEMAERLGDPYRLLLVGAGRDVAPTRQVLPVDYERDPVSLAGLIASCDAFVHANPKEPFGLVTLEALAAGVPVVGPKTGGTGELIDESIGQRAQSASAEHLAEAVEALFAKDQAPVRAAARARALERHSWDRTFTGLMGIYGDLLGREVGRPAQLLRYDA